MPETESIKASWKQAITGWLVSAVVTAAVAFGTSYLSTRDTLGDMKNDVEVLRRDADTLTTGQDRFVTKEVQAVTNQAVVQGLEKIDSRMGRIEQTQTEILLRLPAHSSNSK